MGLSGVKQSMEAELENQMIRSFGLQKLRYMRGRAARYYQVTSGCALMSLSSYADRMDSYTSS